MASSRKKEQPMSDEKPMGQVIQIDEARIRDHLGEMVRGTVEETLNAMLGAEADRLCGAGRYERNEAWQDTRAGSYDRTLQTSAGEVNLKVPKLRRQTFETAIIERYRRRESSVEEALIEMYLAGISVRRVEDITEALWGTRVSPSTVSNLNKKIYAKIEAWRNRRIEGEHPYLYLDGIVMKRTWAGEVRNVSLLVASAVSSEGFREILGICEGAKEDKSGWSAFLRHLVERGLKGVQLIICDACRGLTESAAEYLPEARWQRCMVRLNRSSATFSDQSPRGEPYAQGYPCPGEPGRGRPQGARDRRRPAHRQDEHGGRSRRAERVRNAHLLRLPGHPLAEDTHQQPARADHARDSPADPCRWSVPRRPVMPQPGGRATALHRRHRMVHQVLHEHAASLSAATHANRSRRLIKCAKDSD